MQKDRLETRVEYETTMLEYGFGAVRDSVEKPFFDFSTSAAASVHIERLKWL